MALEIAGLLARTNAAPPARRGGAPQTPVRIKQEPDGSIVASASYRGASMVVRLPPQRLVSVGASYDVAGDPQALVGNIWNSIAKGVAALHHSKIVQATAAGVLAVYGVPPGVTMKAMDVTGDLLDKARQGNPRARQRVEQIGQRTRAGDQTAARAAAAIKHRNLADRRARAAMDLLYRAQRGNPRAQAAVQSIEAAAGRSRPAAEALRAMRAVLDASAGRTPARRPAPSARAARRRAPAPPARAAQGRQQLSLQNARVLRTRTLPNGKRELVVEVGGAGMDWIKSQLFYKGPPRQEAAVFGLRDAYVLGTTG